MFLWWHLKSACVKRGGGVYQINSREGMCADLTVIPDQHNTAADLARVHFFFFFTSYRWNCRWLSHFERFKCVLQILNESVNCFHLHQRSVFHFLALYNARFHFCTNMGFSDSFLHYYAVLLRALGAPAVWVSCRPPVPADPVVTALLIICGPQLPDSRTEHVRIRSTEQTRGRRQSFFGPLLSVSLLAASIATA